MAKKLLKLSSALFLIGLGFSLLMTPASARIAPECADTWTNSIASYGCGDDHCHADLIDIIFFWYTSGFNSYLSGKEKDQCEFEAKCIDSHGLCTSSYSHIIVKKGDSDFDIVDGELIHN